jgi:hypothetical protein
LALEGQQIGGPAHDLELSLIGGGRVRRSNSMAVDRTKLKKRIHPVEGHQIDAERVKDLFKGDLEACETIDVEIPRFEKDAGLEV